MPNLLVVQACNHQNLKCVPLYDTLGENAVEFIMNHSEATGAFCQGSKLKTLTAGLQAVKSNIKLLAYWGETTEDAKKVEYWPKVSCCCSPVLSLKHSVPRWPFETMLFRRL